MISFFRQSIAAKITLVLTVSLIVSTLVFSSVLLFSANKFFATQDNKMVIETVNKQETKFGQYYSENIKIIKLIAGLLAKRPDDVGEILKDFVELYPSILGFSITSNSKVNGNDTDILNMPLEYLRKELEIEEVFNLEDEFYRKNKINISEGVFLYPLVQKNSEKRQAGGISVLRAEIVTKNFKVLLIISADEIINKLQIKNKKWVSFIADRSGVFIIHPNPLKQMSYQKEIKYFIEKEFKSPEFVKFLESKLQKSFFGSVSYKGEVRDLFIKRLNVEDNYSFLIGGHYPNRKRIDFIKFIGRTNLIILTIVLLILVIMGGVLTRFLLKNLDEITEQAKLFTQGEQDIDIQVKSQDEIGILALTFQGMIRQVNERARVLRKSERRIRDARDQAEQALSSKSQLLEDLRIQKAEIERVGKDKDDLLAIVSHDLKNPLAVVETSMDLILEEEKGHLSEITNDLIRRSKSSARIALNLITDLLDLARLEGGIKIDFERFRVDEVIISVVDSFFLKAREKNISIVIGETHDWEIIADYGRIVQIISNILSNSIKFTPNDGRISIEFNKYETDFLYEGNTTGIEIIISDNGPGIPSDKLVSIFDKFAQARTTDRKIGTGLGLAICKNICELHNGEISVESVEGRGASFKIRLPRLVDHNFKEIVSEGHSLSILIVNDNEAIRRRLKSLLLGSTGNYSVLEAKNGEEMLKVLETGAPGVIVLDYDMPVMNGLDAFKEMQRLSPKLIPTIFLSEGLEGEELIWIKKQVSDVLSGKVLEEEVVKKVEALIGAQSLNTVGSKIDPSRKTVLVVDDEEGIRELLIEELTNIGVNTLAAKNGVEALFLLQKYTVDLVISDIRMGEMDGLTLTKKIKKEYSEIEVILVSANIEGLSEKVSRNLGINHVFIKPFNMKDMSDAVVACLKSTKNAIPLRASEVEIMNSLAIGQGKEKVENDSLTLGESENSGVKEDEVPKVLLVDDSEDMQALFKAILRKENFSVDTADNGAIGVESFINNDYVAVFMDMNMPVLNGLDAVKRMRKFEEQKKKSATTIILLTANHLEAQSSELNSGFDDYIQKPISKNKILQVLNNEKIKNE